jgi:hypothetical protein
MATLIRYTGEQDSVLPADKENGFSLAEIYVLLNCDTVQTVMLRDGRIMLIDENAKLKRGAEQRYNDIATVLLARAGGIPGDWITGHALICDYKEFQ